MVNHVNNTYQLAISGLTESENFANIKGQHLALVETLGEVF